MVNLGSVRVYGALDEEKKKKKRDEKKKIRRTSTWFNYEMSPFHHGVHRNTTICYHEEIVGEKKNLLGVTIIKD